LVLLVLTATLLALGLVINPHFLSPINVSNILTMSSLLGFIALGQTLVVISGDNGLDLSVGGMMSLAAIISYTIMRGRDSNFLPAILAIIGIGTVLGFFNALGIISAKVPALVMTLAMANVMTSVQQLYTGGNPKGAPSPIAVKVATSKALPFLPWLAVVWIAVIVIAHFFLSHSVYGKQLFATGANPYAAYLAGVRVKRIRMITYTLCGILSALAGFWLCAYNGVLYVNAGISYVMPSVAAVVIGGASLAGGKGTYTGTVAGALILTIINNLLVMLNTDEAGRFITNGIILIVLFAVYTRHPKIRQ
jgi:ribose transport system permease protein